MSKGKAEKGKRLRGGWVAFVCVLILMLAITACSSGQSKDSAGSEAMQEAPGAAAAADAIASSSVQDSVKALEKSAAYNAAVTTQATSAEPAQAVEGGGIGPIADPDTGMNRKVIYKANVTMKVPDYDAAENQLKDAIHLSGSYVLQFNNSIETSGKGATYVIKVPADGFSPFIDRLRQIQKDLQLQMEGSDVTEEYVDLNARLEAKKTAEARLLSFMDKATKSDDLVRFSSELAALQEQIEQLKGRMRYLDQNVAFSTVNVRLYEGVADVKTEEKKDIGVGGRMADALSGSAKALGQFGEALLVFVAALLPVVAVAAVIGVPAFFIVRGQRRARREASAHKRREWNAPDPSTTPADEAEDPE